ncbi:hypothetical protein RHODGE_RHODGE_04586 [Rhodoplanes serenus]|uniref:Uncharacterized protein n=1 Tax=Rhodoplanes serenus TaxID=200615 RepID=A0A3S4BJG2_9BRAD|nr:hypothetical protein [Rhodoplanes serenus]VCU11375.1 hypothetical protein RHODGE_RHODGE_04586 [Rhodoplanes serenus]
MARHDSRRALPDALHATAPVLVEGAATPLGTSLRTTLRERLDRDGRLAVRMIGVAYLILWGITWWSLDHGATVLTSLGACRLEPLSELFVWRCLPEAPLPAVVDLLNGVLAATLWAPAVVLAAVSQPDVRLMAAVLVGLHLVGLPAALLVVIRAGVRLCDGVVRGRMMRGRIKPVEASDAAPRRRAAPMTEAPNMAAAGAVPIPEPGAAAPESASLAAPAGPGREAAAALGPVATLRRLAGVVPAATLAPSGASSGPSFRDASGSGASGGRRRPSRAPAAGPPVLPRSTFGLRRAVPI